MVEQGRVGFRPPLTSVLPVAGVLILLGLVFPFDGMWVFVVVFITFFGALRTRQLMILGDDCIEVTVMRTRRIPWSQIEGFESGSAMRGGTVIRTTEGDINSIAPCSWWGGPADARDLETLRRMRAAHGRKR